jgi:hypothetical protein
VKPKNVEYKIVNHDDNKTDLVLSDLDKINGVSLENDKGDTTGEIPLMSHNLSEEYSGNSLRVPDTTPKASLTYRLNLISLFCKMRNSNH